MNKLRMHYLLTDYIVGIILICLPLYYKTTLGLDAFEVGLIFGIGGIFAVLSAIVSSVFAQQITNKKLVLNIGLFSMILGVICLMILSYRGAITFGAILMSSIFIFLMRTTMYILGDELATSYVQKDSKITFGKIRSFGSIGWGLNFLINGFIMAKKPELFLPAFLIATIAIWLNSFGLPNVHTKEESTFKIKDIKKIFKYKNYVVYLFATTLMWIIMNNMNMFIEYTLKDTGGNIATFFIISLLVIALDMGVTHFSGIILYKLKSKKYFLGYLILILLKVALLLIFPIPIIIYITIIFDPFIYGMLLPFNSMFIKKSIPSNLSTIALMLSAASSEVFVSLFAPIFGYLYKDVGTRGVFFLMLVLSIVSLGIATKLKFNSTE